MYATQGKKDPVYLTILLLYLASNSLVSYKLPIFEDFFPIVSADLKKLIYNVLRAQRVLRRLSFAQSPLKVDFVNQP